MPVLGPCAHSLFDSADQAPVGGQFSAPQGGVASENKWQEGEAALRANTTLASDWVRLLRDSGFEIEDLIDVRPPEDATTRYQFVTTDWARKWPAEEVWKVRKRA